MICNWVSLSLISLWSLLIFSSKDITNGKNYSTVIYSLISYIKDKLPVLVVSFNYRIQSVWGVQCWYSGWHAKSLPCALDHYVGSIKLFFCNLVWGKKESHINAASNRSPPASSRFCTFANHWNCCHLPIEWTCNRNGIYVWVYYNWWIDGNNCIMQIIS